MSVILKIPFVHKILSVLSSEQLTVLESYVNGVSLPALTDVSLEPNEPNTLNTTFIGVSYVRMELSAQKALFLNGFLCYVNANNCCLFTVNKGDSEEMSMVKINPTNLSYEFVNESLNVEEFRREIYDLHNITSTDITATQFVGVKQYVDSIKDTIVANQNANGFIDIQIGHDLEVDGKVRINSSEDIVDNNGNPIAFGRIALYDLELTETSNGSRVFQSTESAFSNKHVHIMFEIEGTGVHSGADFDLHPYNGSVCVVTFPITIEGETINGFAHINENGKVVINVSSMASTSTMTVLAHYFIYN